MLFLEIWANLSDVQVCQQLRYNVLYRYFCRIGWEDEVPDDTTLVLVFDSFDPVRDRKALS